VDSALLAHCFGHSYLVADKFDPPGPLLDRAAQPKLFAQIDQVAASLNERSPSAVYLIGEPNASVADRGGVLGFGSRRVMCLGLPLFSVLTISELRAVLAHEFAHYYTGDTSLSPWVYRAQTVVIRSYKNIGELQDIGHIHLIRVMFSLAALIIQSYFTFFLRIIYLISRKQEHRSDELACLIAGKQPTIRCLEKIHYAGFFWPIYWASEVAPLLDRNVVPDIGEGFRRSLAAPSVVTFTQTGLTGLLKTVKANPFDSHPTLAERVAAMEVLNTKEHPSNEFLASSLLLQQQAVEWLFEESKSSPVPPTSFRRVDWDDVAILVTIPRGGLRSLSSGRCFSAKKAASLPVSTRLSEIGSRLPDPKGRLLTREQRTRSARLLGIVGRLWTGQSVGCWRALSY
jgi:heat shock protein HtpX